MSQKQTFLPESLYSMDYDITLEKINILYQTQTPIIGTVTRLDIENQMFEVHLGKSFKGFMSFSESTIYTIFKDDGSISGYISSLVGKKIRANILSIKDNTIYLSRKTNMENALKVLENSSTIPYAEITAFSRLSAFFDIGEGLVGRCYGKHFAQTIYNNIRDIGIETNSIMSVEILNCDPETKYFNLSRISFLPNVSDTIHEGDYVSCKVFHQLNKVGYYVLIGNELKALLDSKYERLYYGDMVTAKVKKITPKGPHLKFIDYVV